MLAGGADEEKLSTPFYPTKPCSKPTRGGTIINANEEAARSKFQNIHSHKERPDAWAVGPERILLLGTTMACGAGVRDPKSFESL